MPKPAPERHRPSGFDRIARPYRSLEYLTLGRSLERCRLHLLGRLHDRRHALILGDGDGRFTAHLLWQNPQLIADAVDISAAMLALLRRNCESVAPGSAQRLAIHHTNALAYTPAGTQPYDLVVTHFFLDCLTQSELESLTARIAPTLTPDALWLVSDFRIPSGPMRLPARLLVRLLYLVFRILTGLRTTRLPNHASALTRAGFCRVTQNYSLGGLLTTELWRRI